MLQFLTKGIFETVDVPEYGRQDIGVSPGGAMDRFSFQCGKILLQPLKGVVVLEMIWAPVVRFNQPQYFVLTGARHADVRLGGRKVPEGEIPVEHGRVTFAPAESVLQFGAKDIGFRSYLSCAPAVGPADGIAGRSRGNFSLLCRWSAKDGSIRFVRGPEYGRLIEPSVFTKAPWRVSRHSSKMGMRLERDGDIPAVSQNNMVSVPVSDGTVQLTPAGPIVLLRHRQTIGGYPRIFNVISADVDRLAQFAPDQLVRFREVTMERALEVARTRAEDLTQLAERFSRNDNR